MVRRHHDQSSIEELPFPQLRQQSPELRVGDTGYFGEAEWSRNAAQPFTVLFAEHVADLVDPSERQEQAGPLLPRHHFERRVGRPDISTLLA